ncbi:hypothetical protein [Nitrobacter sp.]|uniref:hypothetical protein n=1 Tax=Nitrobacter sp. TaxID=29420 RepID=UPI00399D574F
MRILGIAALCAALLLAGCSTTPADLEAKATPVVQTYPDNYQEIYRRVSTTAKRCFARNTGPYSSYAVDADLYPDLGYGEVTLSLVNTITRNYYLSVRIEKQPKGSRLTMRTGNTLATNTYIDRIEAWASGDDTCPL